MSKKVLSYLILLMFITLTALFQNYKLVDAKVEINDNEINNFNDRYSTVLSTWKSEGFRDDIQYLNVIKPSDFILDMKTLLDANLSHGYNDRVFYWDDSAEVSIKVNVENTGLYEIYLDHYSMTNSVVPIEISITVNDKEQYYEASQVTLETLWKNEENDFGVDRYGNDVLPKQIQEYKWINSSIRDSSKLYLEPLKFKLDKGENIISFKKLRGSLLLGNITIKSHEENLNYNDYLNINSSTLVNKVLIKQEAEITSLKNSPSIRPGVSRDPKVLPFSINKLKLNILSSESYKKGGQRVDYDINVLETGYYYLTFKVLQNNKPNSVVYRTLYINGEIPFKEVEHIPFYYTSKYKNVTLKDKDDKPYSFFLEKGVNTISFEVDSTMYRDVYENVSNIMSKINDLTLSIKKLTGNNLDSNRDWRITEYLPNITKDLQSYADSLQENYEYIKSLNNTKKESEEVISLKLAISKLRELSKRPNDIPKNLNVLSEGSGSAAQLLGDVLPKLIDQPLNIDSFYIHTNVTLPKANANIFTSFWVGIQRFFLSFFDTKYDDKATDDEIEIWVNRPRQYVDLIQKMADDNFTKETGIKVKFSLLANEGKLLLANSANNQPDVAMGISSWIPYEFALRGANHNLRDFDGFEQFISIYQPESLVPMVYNDGVYGIPETENFYVLFYRKDILEKLDIPIPKTWDEVTDILPELQRYGMNFYIPLANPNSFKSFDTTAPFIYQFGGQLYSEDGMSAMIDSENSINAIKYMTDLFTIYSMPLQVPNFYNEFRYGRIPIGVADFGTYIQLMNAAPEIAGLWDIALYPGVEKSDGHIDHFAPGAQQSLMVFEKSKKKAEAWEFLQWWMSSEIQVEFADNLVTTMGPEYMWNSANIEAFSLSNWPEEHKKVIIDQWSYLKEVPKIPGSYIVERELSNIWNKVVYNGENLRNAVDDSVIKMNNEIERKMTEFGFLKDNQIVIPYRVPNGKLIEGWTKDEEE